MNLDRSISSFVSPLHGVLLSIYCLVTNILNLNNTKSNGWRGWGSIARAIDNKLVTIHNWWESNRPCSLCSVCGL